MSQPSAAVAVLVRGWGTSDPQVLLGRRSVRPEDPWSGHLAFPGGRRNSTDLDLFDTACRECLEEAGVFLDRSRLIGPLADVQAGPNRPAPTWVRPWLVRADDLPEPHSADGEMDSWFWLPLRDLDNPGRQSTIEVEDKIFPAISCGPIPLWGMTLAVLRALWDGPMVQGMEDLWLDYDGTLYAASHELTQLVDQRITAWVAKAKDIPLEAADKLRTRLYKEHGNTLRGMMREADTDPNAYLNFVFDFPDVHLPPPDLGLARSLHGLRWCIFTNARADYVERGLSALGIASPWPEIHDIASFGWRAKPEPELVEEMLRRRAVPPQAVVFVDDRLDNLQAARDKGIRTVLVDETGLFSSAPGDAPSFPDWIIRKPAEIACLLHPRLGTGGLGTDPA